jgi:hypothetical protein
MGLWPRFLPAIVLLILWIVVLSLRRLRKQHIAWGCFLLVVGVSYLPFDVTFLDYPGSPRFVPLVMGLPTEETAKRAESGEVVLGGCIVSGHEPRWVLVW